MSRSDVLIRLNRQELSVILEALASLSSAEPAGATLFRHALATFQRAPDGLSFKVSFEDLETATQALASHSTKVASNRRGAIEQVVVKLSSYLLTPSISVPATVQRLSDVFINRHPICHSDMDVFAYELLAARKKPDGYLAITRTILDRFTKAGLNQLVGDRLAFVSVPRGAVVRGYCQSLPKQRVVLEVSDEGVDPDEALFQALAKLSTDGFRLAIADLLIRKSDHPLASIAYVIKLDFGDLGKLAIEARLETLKKFSSRLLADNVDTHQDFEFACDLGFDYFQGYFFCKPNITGKDIPLNRLATMRLLARLRDPAVDAQELGEMISQDVPLAFKLLEFANSAYVGLSGKVESISHGVSLVGLERIRTWASLLMFSRMEDKPRELMITALIRARMCESLAEASGRDRKVVFFTVGLFSVLDAVLDCPMVQALDLLPLSDEIREALLYREGVLGDALNCVLAYEQDDWTNVRAGKLTDAEIRDCYLSSITWTQTHAEGLGI